MSRTFITKIASLNINGIQSHTRVWMLAEFISKYEIEIALLQEVTTPQIVGINGYNAQLNIGSDMRETAILARKELLLTKIDRVRNGRAIAAEFNGIRIVKVYAPSSTAERTQRERFINSELPQLLTVHLQPILMGETLTALYYLLAPRAPPTPIGHSLR